jgi:branched-chain amino acid transport system permease protein
MQIIFMVPQILINGLFLSLLYILMALGFNMIFGIMGVVNFAHGEFYMLGAFIVYQMVKLMNFNYLVGLSIAVVMVGALGMLLEPVIFKRVRKIEAGDFVVSLALAFILQSIALMIWGPEDLGIPSVYTGIMRMGSLVIPVERLMTIVYSTALLIGFYLFVKFTRTGQSMRAVAQDAEVASLQGIRVEKVYVLSFGIGCALAGVAGALISPIFSIFPYMGGFALLKAFIVVVIGGLGSIPGAVLGGILLGMGESFISTFLGGAVSDIMSFIGVLILLIFKPEGLLRAK